MIKKEQHYELEEDNGIVKAKYSSNTKEIRIKLNQSRSFDTLYATMEEAVAIQEALSNVMEAITKEGASNER